MELAHLDSPTTDPARKPRRYQLVSRRVEATERVKRFRLARMEALPRLDKLEPVARLARPAD